MTKAHHAVFIDMMPYDTTLPMAIIDMKTLDGADLPTAGCGSVIWAGSGEDKSMMLQHIFRELRQNLYKLHKDGVYKVPGLANMPASTDSASDRPTFKQDDFTVTHPMDDDTLPVLQSARAQAFHKRAYWIAVL